MPETHVNIVTGPSNAEVVFHNSGQTPLPPSAGKPVAATVKPVGQANAAAVHGQISNSTIVIDNPG